MIAVYSTFPWIFFFFLVCFQCVCFPEHVTLYCCPSDRTLWGSAAWRSALWEGSSSSIKEPRTCSLLKRVSAVVWGWYVWDFKVLLRFVNVFSADRLSDFPLNADKLSTFRWKEPKLLHRALAAPRCRSLGGTFGNGTSAEHSSLCLREGWSWAAK